MSTTFQIPVIAGAVRKTAPRIGSTHTYVLNGSLLRDVLVDGRWVTFHVEPAGCPV